MKRALITLAAALVAAAPAAAQTPPDQLRIVSLFDPIVYGQKAFVNGQLMDGDNGAQTITLQQAPFPFTTWTDVAQATTDYQGYYTFMLLPTLTTHYRTSWNGGQLMSTKEVKVQIISRLTFTARRARGTTIRFRGTLAPAHRGQSVLIQRQTRSGGWHTATRARLRGGTTFAGRLRMRTPAKLRAAFVSHGDVLPGYSVAVRV